MNDETRARFANVARMARDEARSRRHVLIVTRTAFDAVRVMDALEDALRPRDGAPALLRGQGLWSARSNEWGEGSVEIRVGRPDGASCRGRYADTVLLSSDVSRSAGEAARPCTAGASAPLVAVW